jgi:serine/threonine-protein kinase
MIHMSKSIFTTGYVVNNKWSIIGFIGKGAMGEVYLAHQTDLKRDVAIKIISQELLQSFENDPKEIENALHRFRREVQAMARVRHANVLQIFDNGSEIVEQDGKDLPVEYIVMEYIRGASLESTISEEGFYPRRDLVTAWLSDYFLPLLNGVEAIHAGGIAHRDLKPENVLLDDKIPKIADFGLACSLCLKPVTQSLDVKGTPAYMSPEHFFDFKNADQQSDIYSLGKILFEAVDGRISSKSLPFTRVALSKPDTPFFRALDKIIQEATSEKKEDRFKSVGDLRNAILKGLVISNDENTRHTPPVAERSLFYYRAHLIWAGIVIAIVSMAAMTLWHLSGNPGKEPIIIKKPEIPQVESAIANPGIPSKIEPAKPMPPARSIMGEDGITMHLIPGGEIEAAMKGPDVGGQTLQIKPFYMDEISITNYHFIKFLNEVKKSLTIENGVVKHNNEIWFYLGEGTEPYEHIIYEQERFQLIDTQYASRPVTRVTWYGASAYARFYGKRLLSDSEWEYAVLKNRGYNEIHPPKNPNANQAGNTDELIATESRTDMTATDNSSQTMTPHGDPLDLKDSETAIREWAVKNDTDQENQTLTEHKNNVSYSSLIMTNSQNRYRKIKTFRYPWEAFPDAGFRCASSLRGNLK